MTTSFDHDVYQRLFGAEGHLAAQIAGYLPRPQQLSMASVVAGAIAENDNALIEAGTGTGKTFAYLLPVMLAGKRAIVSTGTKTLQDQLFYQDIPTLKRVLSQVYNTRLDVALLKGRSNYLCPQRLARNLDMASRQSNPRLLSQLVSVREWSQRTQTGDLTELADLEGASVTTMITSSVDNCLGSECPRFSECPVYRARDKARQADLVIVNHHLLFADMALKEDGVATLLPEVDIVVVDEAHQMIEVARGFFGERISSFAVHDLVRDLLAECASLGGDERGLIDACHALEATMKGLADGFATAPSEALLDDLLVLADIVDVIESVDLALGHLVRVLQSTAARSAIFAQGLQRTLKLADYFALLTAPGSIDDNTLHWLERRERGFTLHRTPVSVADLLGAYLGDQRSWIMTSATLSVAGSFDHFKRQLGVVDIREEIYASPFDFKAQVKAHVPAGLPSPGTDQHTRQLVHECLPLLHAHDGRSFLLFTSYRALRLAGEILEGIPELSILVQGNQAKATLLARFRQIPGCVLLATHSFWEGVDVRGADLRLLVIDKLPFSSPADPMTAAQYKAAVADGGNGFYDHAIPEAAISLKQGFGRLIRQETDRGLFVMGDPRLLTRSYGKLLVRSLPEMDWLSSAEEARAYLQALTAD